MSKLILPGQPVPAAPSIIPPKRPIGPSWSYGGIYPQDNYEGHYWFHKEGYVVISAMEVAEGGHLNQPIPHYHLSISKGHKRRCSSADALYILTQFGMQDAMEDNHVPGGFVRNYWMPVAEDQRRVDCKCVESEPALREDKGDFVWRGVPNGK